MQPFRTFRLKNERTDKMKTRLTLLDVVRAVQDFARTDREVVAVLWHLLLSRQIRFVRRTLL